MIAAVTRKATDESTCTPDSMHDVQMINQREAHSTAEEVLRGMSSQPGVPRLAITRVQEFPTYWIFYYQSIQYIESGSILDMTLGNAPILVDQATGRPHVTGTAYAMDYYLAEYADGRHTCKLCRDPVGG